MLGINQMERNELKSRPLKIALVIKTDGLEYDDRVRKEILTIQKLFPNITFKIFAMLPENKEYEGVTGYGVPFKTVYVPARDKYPSAKKATLKAYQFYSVLKKDLRTYDAIWCANIDTSFFPFLCKNDRILWDLHELPGRYMGNGIMRMILKYMFGRCKVVLHANPQRRDYLIQQGVITEEAKHIPVRNYPNFDEEEKDYDERYHKFKEWKGERSCVYLQGLANDSRASFESICAVLRYPELCAVVVGGFDKEAKARLEKQYGDELANKIFFVGKVAQLRIPQYVKQCKISLIFYKNVRPNNYYCEANRFYQAVILGLPVVVGSNPSMKELVDKYGFGISIDDDGSDIDKIANGIKEVIVNYDKYHANNLKYRDNLLWDKQEEIFKDIVEKLFK